MPAKIRRHGVISSRLKALLSLVENFSRATLTNAGATSAKWKTVVVGWGVSGGKGTSSAIGALISTVFASSDATLTVKNPAPGTGPAFWVTDSGNWWSVTHNVTNICQTCSACGSYNTCTYCSSTTYGADSSCGCNSYYNYTCCNSYYTYDCCTSYYDYTYTCCQSYYTYTCCQSTYYYFYSCCTRYYSYSCCIYTIYYYYTCCTGYGYNGRYGYGCVSYGACQGSTCGYSGTCTSCSSYGTCSASTCNSYGSCTACSQYSTCNASSCGAYGTCTACGSYTTCTACGGYASCTYCNGYSYGTSSACGCAGYYTYSCNCADNHKIDLVSKINGTESVISSTGNSTTNIAGIKVTTSGNNVTAQAYSDTNFTNQLGSNLTTTNSGQKSKEHGIISRASNNSQGYTIDEFRVNS